MKGLAGRRLDVGRRRHFLFMQYRAFDDGVLVGVAENELSGRGTHVG